MRSSDSDGIKEIKGEGRVGDDGNYPSTGGNNSRVITGDSTGFVDEHPAEDSINADIDQINFVSTENRQLVQVAIPLVPVEIIDILPDDAGVGAFPVAEPLVDAEVVPLADAEIEPVAWEVGAEGGIAEGGILGVVEQGMAVVAEFAAGIVEATGLELWVAALLSTTDFGMVVEHDDYEDPSLWTGPSS